MVNKREISSVTTTRLRTLQSSTITTSFVKSDSQQINPQTFILREMAKRTEIEPLLSTPPHETQYTSDKLNESFNSSNSVHLSIDNPTETTMQLQQIDDDNIESYREEDRSLLIAEKPVVTRIQVKNVVLMNLSAFLFLFVNMTLNLTVLSIIHERIPMNQPHLPDIAFDILPDHRNFLDVAEYFIIFQSVCIFLLLFFHKHRSIILRRICLIMGVIYLFRAICMASTQLPLASKNYYCSPQLQNSSEPVNISLAYIGTIASRVFYMSLGMGLSINGRHSFCGDYIFSGHTVILVLTYLIFQEYLLPSRRRTILWKLVHLFQFIMTFISVICILIARGHYLIDIVLAYFVTTRIFYIYHSLCSANTFNLRSISNYFNRLWWWPVFIYFENVKFSSNYNSKSEDLNQVQRSFEWPLPWPKRFIRRKHRNQFMA